MLGTVQQCTCFETFQAKQSKKNLQLISNVFSCLRYYYALYESTDLLHLIEGAV